MFKALVDCDFILEEGETQFKNIQHSCRNKNFEVLTLGEGLFLPISADLLPPNLPKFLCNTKMLLCPNFLLKTDVLPLKLKELNEFWA